MMVPQTLKLFLQQLIHFPQKMLPSLFLLHSLPFQQPCLSFNHSNCDTYQQDVPARDCTLRRTSSEITEVSGKKSRHIGI